jgi:hypothetical protein
MKMASFYPECDGMKRGMLLERLQELSVTMLKAATTAMAVRSPITQLSLTEIAGGCVAFSGADVPLSRAIGIGTAGVVGEDELEEVESFYQSRNSDVRVVISERTNASLPGILRARGYQSDDFLQNWWLPLDGRQSVPLSTDVEIFSATPRQSEEWVRTVTAGFLETNTPVNEANLPQRMLDTFYCLGFANGARPFFAKYKGAIAGGGVLHITGETASIRTASCRIEHRNQGVQRALLAHRLDAAAKAGCRFAFSSTDQPGATSRNLRRFGFNALSTSFTMSLAGKRWH